MTPPTVIDSETFRQARRDMALTVAECAQLCNVSERTIRRWETGTGRGDGREPHSSACRLMEIALSHVKTDQT